MCRIMSFIEHGNERLEKNNIERAQYFMSCSLKDLKRLVTTIEQFEDQFSKEASNDAVQKQKA